MDNIKKYRRKQTECEALQFKGSEVGDVNFKKFVGWIGSYGADFAILRRPDIIAVTCIDDKVTVLRSGDYLVKPKGEGFCRFSERYFLSEYKEFTNHDIVYLDTEGLGVDGINKELNKIIKRRSKKEKKTTFKEFFMILWDESKFLTCCLIIVALIGLLGVLGASYHHHN